jgi:hypothetical protein
MDIPNLEVATLSRKRLSLKEDLQEAAEAYVFSLRGTISPNKCWQLAEATTEDLHHLLQE